MPFSVLSLLAYLRTIWIIMIKNQRQLTLNKQEWIYVGLVFNKFNDKMKQKI